MIMRVEDQRYAIEIDNIQETRWSELLSRFDDATFYQTWGYGSMRRTSRLTHLVVKRDSEIVATVQGEIVRIPGLKIGIAHFPWGGRTR
jgi:hypothetical protein